MTKVQKHLKRQQKPVISPVMIAAVVVVSLLLVGGLIYLGNQSQSRNSGPLDIDQFPALGDSNAPVTMIEFSDYG